MHRGCSGSNWTFESKQHLTPTQFETWQLQWSLQILVSEKQKFELNIRYIRKSVIRGNGEFQVPVKISILSM